MKKFVKLSLAAAVASTGFVSANAGALEDAIKNTTIGGYATYRYDDRTIDNLNDGGASFSNSTNNRHKVVLAVISKINDDLSYTYAGAVASTSDTTTSSVDYMGGQLHSVYSYFTYTGIQNLTLNAGQQTIDTPFTDTYDDIGETQEGTGLTGAYNAGPVTVVAGFMNQNKLTGEGYTATDAVNSADLYVVAAKGKVANVALDVTAVDLEDTAEGFSAGASTSFDVDGVKVSPYARYTTLELDGGNENTLWFVGAKAAMGKLSGNISYTSTANDGGGVAFDDDAASVNQGWGLNLNTDGATGNMTKLNLGYALTANTSIAINHNMLTNDTTAVDVDSEETFGQLTWKPSKNFYAYLRYGTVETDGADDAQRGRVHMTYKF